MLYLYPTKRHLGVEIVGAEEEHLDLYDALLELIECADGIDEQGVARETPLNARLIDFLFLIRQAQPVPGDYLDDAESPAGAKPEAGDGDEPPAGRGKVLAFPGVTLAAPVAPSSGVEGDGEGEADWDEPFEDGDFEEGLDDDVRAALEELGADIGPALRDGPDGLVMDDDLMVRLLWPEAIHLAFALNEYLGWSDATRDADWTREIRWRPAYGTVLRFQAQLMDCVCGALPARQADQARALFQSPRVSVRDLCPQYLDVLGEDFVIANAKRRRAMLAPAIAEIAKPGPRNAEIRLEAEAKAKELGCPVEEISFTGELPPDMEW